MRGLASINIDKEAIKITDDKVAKSPGRQVTSGGRMEKGYKRLLVWQKADAFAYQIYLETKEFPKEELYGLTSQLRRAAISIPCNIAEGSARHSKNEFRQFLNIALGSLAEAEYLLGFCLRMNYIDKETYNELENLRKNIGGILWNLYHSLT